ncbi:hypothetical protein FRB96_005892 [Tulasnella sp. 330]|nr:hypothetical protein FRB96_005892 [Tulasnella sp. 330]KAG8884558.1 hypothetical protein FRB97_003854 [Tulasnella sp. 331]KAG8889540.1 hypothetical protein FRB98_003808 [Tulasnella sp. 332]
MRIQLPIMSFLVLPLLLLPLHAQWRTRNIPTITIVVALFFTNLTRGVNTIVWAGSVVPKLRVWCDITTKFIIGVQVAIPAASLCITKHLESIASLRQTIETAQDKRRRKIFEICMCGVLPCIIMALHYVVQGHRFDIAEDFGCIATVYISWPAILIVYIPPLALGFASFIYATLAFYWFIKRRDQFTQHLRSNSTGLSTSRYARLMALAVTQVIVETGLGGYIIITSLKGEPLRIWDNWADVHSDFSRISQFPEVVFPDSFWNQLLLTWYLPLLCSLDFFIFFGLGQEAMGEYSRAITWIRIHVFRQTVKASKNVLPTWSAPQRAPRVQTDDLDMASMDDKWDEVGVHVDVESSRFSYNTSQSNKVDGDTQPRSDSAPPVGPILGPDAVIDDGRKFSLTLPPH